jgi:hypothetical protein
VLCVGSKVNVRERPSRWGALTAIEVAINERVVFVNLEIGCTVIVTNACGNVHLGAVDGVVRSILGNGHNLVTHIGRRRVIVIHHTPDCNVLGFCHHDIRRGVVTSSYRGVNNDVFAGVNRGTEVKRYLLA